MSATPPLNNFYQADNYRPEDSIGLMMRHILNSLAQGVELQLANAALTHAQWMPVLKLHLGHANTVAELARECGLSERTLYRKIHQALGVTPYELMLRIRIESAAEALIQTTDKVIDIAQAHAFCDQSAFTQHFRKRIGVTPKQFRMRHQG